MTPPHDPLLLVLDYPGYRAEARFDALRLDEHGVAVRDLLAGALPQETRGAQYAARLLETSCGPGGPVGPVGPGNQVAAVGAYCASAPLAFEVAARLHRASDGRRPLIVLFDAEPGPRETFLASHRATAGQFGSAADPVPDVSAEGLDRDPDALVDALVEDVRGRALAALRGVAADEREAVTSAEQMAATYASWARHLAAAHHSRVAGWPGDVLHIRSADGVRAPFRHGARVVEEIRVDCARKDLLRSPETRAAVLAALAR